MKLKFAFLAVVLSCFSYAQMLSSFEEVEKLRKENPKRAEIGRASCRERV